ncbi:putative transposase [Paracoccus saliphilus]|uniref:Transposase n=1 Tax=Paracoccus saliphilus TaxID=405559 RepID=A0AA46A6J8_9RHOB|nr:putative transposase [Paracoccus saliphilus]
MSEGTFYNWKAKFGGMTVSEAKRLKALEDENAKLKKLLAEQILDLAAIYMQPDLIPQGDLRESFDRVE